MSKLTFTKQIKNNKLSTSKMEVGSSVRGLFVDIQEGKFGPVFILNINNQDVTIFPSGNVKRELGPDQVGTIVTITRLNDVQVRDMTVTNFTVTSTSEQASEPAQVTPLPTARPSTSGANVQQRVRDLKKQYAAGNTGSSNT